MDWSTSDYSTPSSLYTVGADHADEGLFVPDARERRRRCASLGGSVERGSREPFIGNQLTSSPRSAMRNAYAVAWDERPQHYNPSAGDRWAHFYPPSSDRGPFAPRYYDLGLPFYDPSSVAREPFVGAPQAGAVPAESGPPAPAAPPACTQPAGAAAACTIDTRAMVLVLIVLLLVVIAQLIALSVSGARLHKLLLKLQLQKKVSSAA